MTKEYSCKYCDQKDPKEFWASKSRCKKCVSIQDKIKRPEVKRDDREINEIKEYCIRNGISFDSMCQKQEETISKREDKDITEKLTNLDSDFSIKWVYYDDSIDHLNRRLDEMVTLIDGSLKSASSADSTLEMARAIITQNFNPLLEKVNKMQQILDNINYRLNAVENLPIIISQLKMRK